MEQNRTCLLLRVCSSCSVSTTSPSLLSGDLFPQHLEQNPGPTVFRVYHTMTNSPSGFSIKNLITACTASTGPCSR